VQVLLQFDAGHAAEVEIRHHKADGALRFVPEEGFSSLAGPHRKTGQAQQPAEGLTQTPGNINDRDI
jgi:hypothetical protein